jgi:phage baseplate assembly protein W
VSSSYFAFPFDVGANRSTTTADDAAHLRDLVLQVLLTSPGERLNQPEFGCSIRSILFVGQNDALRASAQFIVSQSLERWLGDRLIVDDVAITTPNDADDGVLDIAVTYTVRATGERGGVTVAL